MLPEEALIAESRQRRGRPLAGRDRAASSVLGASFLATAIALALASPDHRLPGVGFLLLAAFVIASSVEFEVGAGVTLAAELVLVPMFLLLPPATVPLWVAAGTLISRLGDLLQGRLHPQRTLVLLASSWYTVGPALVLMLAGHRSPSWDMTPVYIAALGAQLAFDLASSAARECLALGVPPAVLLGSLRWAYLVDVLLAPVGLLAALAAVGDPYLVLLPLPLVGLLYGLARDRQAHVDRAVDLVLAYRDASVAARRDPLTGLANRRAWDEALAASSSNSQGPSKRPVSLVLLDVDDLKAANDMSGHEVGDRLLWELAEVVRSAIREGDLAARIGGDEIAILLPDVDESECLAIVSRLGRALHDHAGVEGIRLSAAIGHASCPPAASLSEAVRVADVRMYGRKHSPTGGIWGATPPERSAGLPAPSA